jgi:hypothetical protein
MPNALFTCIKSKDYVLELVTFFPQLIILSKTVPGTFLPEQPGGPAVVQPVR